MNQFDRNLAGFRFVDIYFDDTLQRIASRELGDAGRWAELAHLNELLPPYIVDVSDTTTAGVLRYGDQMLVPAAASASTTVTDPAKVFGTDCELRNGLLDALDGDFVVVSCRDNLKQALRHRIMTDQGELVFHSDYRCLAHRLIGTSNNPATALLARDYVKAAILRDPRISEVSSVTATISGDSLSVSAEAVPISGKQISVEV